MRFGVYGIVGALLINATTADRALASRCIDFASVLKEADVIEIGVVFSVSPTFTLRSGGYKVDFQILVEEVYRGESRKTSRVQAHVPYPLYIRPGSRLLVAGRQGEETELIQANFCELREIPDEKTERATLFDLLKLVTGRAETELNPRRQKVSERKIQSVASEARASLTWATVVTPYGVCVMTGERDYPGVWRLEIEDSAMESHSAGQEDGSTFAYFAPEGRWDVCFRRRCDSLDPARVRVHWEGGVSEVSVGRGCPEDVAGLPAVGKD
jgi:hypothetical protein